MDKLVYPRGLGRLRPELPGDGSGVASFISYERLSELLENREGTTGLDETVARLEFDERGIAFYIEKK